MRSNLQSGTVRIKANGEEAKHGRVGRRSVGVIESGATNMVAPGVLTQEHTDENPQTQATILPLQADLLCILCWTTNFVSL